MNCRLAWEEGPASLGPRIMPQAPARGFPRLGAWVLQSFTLASPPVSASTVPPPPAWTASYSSPNLNQPLQPKAWN